MSDEADHQQPDPPNSPERLEPELTEDMFTRPDAVLQHLADWSDAVSMDVVLYLPWGLASGTITSGAEYFRWIASTIRGAVAEKEPKVTRAADVYANLFDNVVEVYARKIDDPERRAVSTLGFMHLKDVTCATPGGGSSLRQPYLRVQLSHVTAWTQGALQFEPR